MFNLVISGGTVVDGTGAPAFKADVGVAEGRVALVAGRIEQEAARVIDARGLHVAPGFIDPHTHSDLTLLADPLAQSKVRQGVTTEVIGNCGYSPAPVVGAALDEVTADAAPLDVRVTWSTMAGYFGSLVHQGISVNVVALVGHNTVRGCVLGYGDRQPSAEEQAAMERLTERALDEGARGVSTGLFYPPGFYAGTDEVVGLARRTAVRGGVYASHIRSEGDAVLEAVAEALAIGERSGAFVEISHLKLSGPRNPGMLDRLFTLLDEGVQSGVHFGCDQYPYAASSTWLIAMLPYWAQAGGAAVVARRLADPAVRTRLRRDWDEDRDGWKDRSGVDSWTKIVVSDCRVRPDVAGKSIAEIAVADGADPLETALDLIAISDGQVDCVWLDQSEDNVRAILCHPLVVVGSDGEAMSADSPVGGGQPHPRSYGTFPRVLARYVREQRALSLEEAVRKMTSLTAARFGLTDRGVVCAGARADLVVFDADRVADRATFDEPRRYPDGVPYVIVNGVPVVDEGQHTGMRPGRVL